MLRLGVDRLVCALGMHLTISAVECAWKGLRSRQLLAQRKLPIRPFSTDGSQVNFRRICGASEVEIVSPLLRRGPRSYRIFAFGFFQLVEFEGREIYFRSLCSLSLALSLPIHNSFPWNEYCYCKWIYCAIRSSLLVVMTTLCELRVLWMSERERRRRRRVAAYVHKFNYIRC